MEPLDWSKLPPDLRWLAGPAERYGHYQFDNRIYDFLRSVGPDERRELRELSRRFGDANPAIDAWLSAHLMTVHPEARLVYFTRYLVGTGCDAELL